MWDYLVLAAYAGGAAINLWLAWDIWRSRGACWRLGLGVALIIIFAGLFSGKVKEMQRAPVDASPVAQEL